MDGVTALCRFVQLSARIPLVMFAIYFYGTYLVDDLIDYRHLQAVHAVPGLSIVIQLSLAAVIMVVPVCVFVVFAFDNLQRTTALFVASPIILYGLRAMSQVDTWRLVAFNVYSVTLLLLLPLAVTQRLEPLAAAWRPCPRTKERTALFSLYAVMLLLILRDIFPSLGHEPHLLRAIRWIGLFFVAIPLFFVLDLLALQISKASPGASRSTGAIVLTIITIPFWYALFRLMKF